MFFLALIALALPATSAEAGWRLEVTVKDSGGNVVEGASVKVKLPDGTELTGTTDANGEAKFGDLFANPPANFDITTEKDGKSKNETVNSSGADTEHTMNMSDLAARPRTGGTGTVATTPSPVVNTSLTSNTTPEEKPATEQELASNVRRTMNYYGLALGASLILKTISVAATYDYLTGGNSANSTSDSVGVGGGLDLLYWVPRPRSTYSWLLPTFVMASMNYMPALSAIAAAAAFHFANSVDSYVKVRESVMLRIALGYQFMALRNFYFYGVFGLQGTLLSMLASTNELGNVTEHRERQFVWGPTAGLQVMYPMGFNNVEAFFYGSMMFSYIPGMTVNFRSFSNFQYAARVASWVQPAIMFGMLFQF